MQIDGKNLFPLSLVLPSIRKDTYYMAADRSVFSKARGKLVRMIGSHGYSGKTFSFQRARPGGTFTERASVIETLAMQHSQFKAHTSLDINLPSTAKVPATARADRSHAASVEDGIKSKGYIIARVHKGRLVFGSEPPIHLTAASVKSEMERLAMAHPGVKFVELKITQSVVAGGVSWE
jgi:hypothetical protein